MRHDVVVIGGGLGGLECAYILARAGLDVAVLERGRQAGGSLQCYQRHGLTYDTGFHYTGGLDEGQSLHAAFRHMGLLSLPWVRMDTCFDRVAIGGRTFAFAQGFNEFARALTQDFPAERDAMRRFANLLARSAAAPLAQWATEAPPAPAAADAWEVPAHRYLHETFRDPLLREVLAATSLTNELRRESLPLFSFLHGLAGFVESSWRLKGGGAQIATALADGIRAQGGTVACRSGVVRLETEGGRLARAVCSGGQTYEGRMFVSSLHPASTCSLDAGDAPKMWQLYCRRMAQVENTCGMFTTSLALKPGKLAYPNHNFYVYRHADVWTAARGERPAEGLLVSARVPENASEGLRQVDLMTPMAWAVCKPWEGTPVGQRGDDYLALKAKWADACLTQAEGVMPGLREAVADCHTATPLTWHDYLSAAEGSAYGMRKDCRNPLLTMVSVRTPLPNLYLTGQSVMLHGLHGVTMTALATCGEILGKEHIKGILKV